jgi:hypothetical protein
MIDELGRKSQVIGDEVKHWPTFHLYKRPKKMPNVPKGHTIVCGVEQDGAEGERLFICETLEDVCTLYDVHVMGQTTHITWYHTDALKRPVMAA